MASGSPLQRDRASCSLLTTGWVGSSIFWACAAQKVETYESGVDPTGDMWSQANIRYYVFALLFVLFDVEAVFIFPWATRLEAYGVFGLIEMAIFIFILLLGLLYAWRKGMLRWV